MKKEYFTPEIKVTTFSGEDTMVTLSSAVQSDVDFDTIAIDEFY